ncbi:exonuclease domain-containing protein [Rhodoferax sp.]|uniref:3'-5' exonuclease family protein n=1 Tax=Rhodoferax sp. TaxID=50421 RepID=UPI00374D006F
MTPDFPPLAFVDLETTGGSAGRDRITEVGIVEVDGHHVRRWSQLIHPGTRIPEFIQKLTGISDAMVADQPPFEAVAGEILDRLRGKLFVAHNARFDYGFLRAEFKACGIDWRAPVLCTVKLSRLLFPAQARHNLDTLIAVHGLQMPDRHRALADADALAQFWQILQTRFDAATLQEAVASLSGRPAVPPQLDAEHIDRLPETAGVYLFFDAQRRPLYIGKSKNLRSRVLAHFSAALSNPKEMRLSQQVADIDWIETAGEVGALLLEARLVKHHQPSLNVQLRRQSDLHAWQLDPNLPLGLDFQRPLVPRLVQGQDIALGLQDNLFGPFRSRRAAVAELEELATTQLLCRGVLGLEKITPGKPCFAYQIRKCAGACVGQQSIAQHNLALLTALLRHKVQRWPYPGAVGLREGDALHVVHDWRYLGTAQAEDEVAELLEGGRSPFDFDTYKILSKALAKLKPGQLVQLQRRPENSYFDSA